MIDKGELREIKKSVFSMGDCYLVDDGATIYNWLGSKSSVDEKASSAAHAKRLDDAQKGTAKITTVEEGQEPAGFLQAISSFGPMKIVKKNYAKTMLKDVNTAEFAGYTEWVNMLYRISSE